MELANVYVPVWLNSILAKGNVSEIDIFSLAEKEYGKLSISDRELFSEYLDDLIEEGFIYQKGNFIYKNNEDFIAA